jgi:hypothetical protein
MAQEVRKTSTDPHVGQGALRGVVPVLVGSRQSGRPGLASRHARFTQSALGRASGYGVRSSKVASEWSEQCRWLGGRSGERGGDGEWGGFQGLGGEVGGVCRRLQAHGCIQSWQRTGSGSGPEGGNGSALWAPAAYGIPGNTRRGPVSTRQNALNGQSGRVSRPIEAKQDRPSSKNNRPVACGLKLVALLLAPGFPLPSAALPCKGDCSAG